MMSLVFLGGGKYSLDDKVAEELEEVTDDMAEREVELGGEALSTIQIISKKSRLASYPLDLASGWKHVAALSSALANCGASTRRAIDTASKAGARERIWNTASRWRPTELNGLALLALLWDSAGRCQSGLMAKLRVVE